MKGLVFGFLLTAFFFSLNLAGAEAEEEQPAESPAPSNWIDIGRLDTYVRADEREIRSWVMDNIPAGDRKSLLRWDKNWDRQVFVSPSAAQQVLMHFSLGVPASMMRNEQGLVTEDKLNGAGEPDDSPGNQQSARAWSPEEVDFLLGAVLFFPKSDNFDTAVGPEITVRYWASDQVAFGLGFGWSRWDYERSWSQTYRRAGTTYSVTSSGDVEFFPVTASFNLRGDLGKDWDILLTAGLSYVFVNEDLSASGRVRSGAATENVRFQPDSANDSVTGQFGVQLERGFGKNWRGYVSGGYQVNLERTEVTFSSPDDSFSDFVERPSQDAAFARLGLMCSF